MNVLTTKSSTRKVVHNQRLVGPQLIKINQTKLLIESLIQLKTFCDAQEVCREAAMKFPEDGYFRGSKLEELN